MKILVIQQKRVGDVLVSTLLCEALRAEFPQAEIHYLVYAYTKAVAQNNPSIDQLIEFTDAHKKSPSGFFKFCKTIRAQNYDVVVDAYSKTESWLISRFSGAKTRITYKKGLLRSLLFTHTIAETGKERITEKRLKLLTPLTNTPVSAMSQAPKIHLNPAEQRRQLSVLESSGIHLNKPIVMVGVFGRIPEKTWPKAYMKQLVQELAHSGNVQLIFNYDQDQEQEFTDFVRELNVPPNTIFPNIYGQSLTNLIHLISHCAAYVGNDSGPIHIAKAVGVPTFTIFSPWIPKSSWFTLEGNKNHQAVHLADIEPERYENGEISKKDNVLELYKKITPAYVLEKLNQFLAHVV